jgi:transcriptional regulator with XRE-family HTH domain
MTSPASPDAALASTLRNMRRERGQTQEDLAYHSKITTAALARIERGQANPTWTTVRRIAAALEISLAELGAAVEAADA